MCNIIGDSCYRHINRIVGFVFIFSGHHHLLKTAEGQSIKEEKNGPNVKKVHYLSEILCYVYAIPSQFFRCWYCCCLGAEFLATASKIKTLMDKCTLISQQYEFVLIEFYRNYRICRICRIIFLVILIFKITKISTLQIPENL